MTRTHDIETALRMLDAADQHVDPAGARARADLQRILATDPVPVLPGRPGAPADRPRPAARWRRRAALASCALAAAVTTVLVGLPVLTGGDEAFASWTSDPAGLTGAERAEAAGGCRSALQGGAGAELADDVASARPVVAERRGVWTTLVLAGADGFSALCVTDSSAGLFAHGMIGSVGRTTDRTAPGPRDVVPTDLGTGSMSAGELSLAAGMVGTDVVGVAYDSPGHGVVTATVASARFALWLPGDEFEDAASSGVPVSVTYRDGTTGTVRLAL